MTLKLLTPLPGGDGSGKAAGSGDRICRSSGGSRPSGKSANTQVNPVFLPTRFVVASDSASRQRAMRQAYLGRLRQICLPLMPDLN